MLDSEVEMHEKVPELIALRDPLGHLCRSEDVLGSSKTWDAP